MTSWRPLASIFTIAASGFNISAIRIIPPYIAIKPGRCGIFKKTAQAGIVLFVLSINAQCVFLNLRLNLRHRQSN
jgi:hypothetical protein